MHRRSKSSSSIPLPKRSSQRDGSLDRKLSKGVTPLAGQKKGGLFLSTPATSARGSNTPINSAVKRSSRASSTGFLSSSATKDKKHLQKLWNDKRWVAEQHARIQDYVENSEVFDPQIANRNNLKPPSLNTFIYVCSTLLSQLFPQIVITGTNYKDVIAKYLKILRYPGTFPTSVLKIANTMHAWPQVVTLFSWLIDKINLDINLTSVNIEDDDKKIESAQITLDYFYEKYNRFCLTRPEEELEEVDRIFEKRYAEILDIDEEAHKELHLKVLNNRKYKEQLDTQVQQLYDEDLLNQGEIMNMNTDIVTFEEYIQDDTQCFEEEIHFLVTKVEDIKKKQKVVKEHLSSLENIVCNQQCTYQEKKQILKQTIESKRRVHHKKNKIEELKKMLTKMEEELSVLQNKVEGVVYGWNIALTKTLIPELQKLQLREKDFHEPEFLKEIQNAIEKKGSLECQFKEELNIVKKDVSKLENSIKNAERDLETLQEEIEQIKLNINQNKSEISNFENEILDILSATEQQKKSHNVELEKMKVSMDASEKNQLTQIKELQERNESLKDENKKFIEKSICFLVDKNNFVINNISQMNEIKNKTKQEVKNMLNTLIKKSNEHKDFLESMKKNNPF